MYFPVAGVELNPLIPVILGALVSLILGQVGLTGGIATLPFMMSVLGFTSPSVSSTNLIFVLMAPLGSVYSYWKEKRMLWRLSLMAAAGGIVGSLLGPLIRVGFLTDITRFKVLFGFLLGFIGMRLFFKRQRDIKVGKLEKTGGSLFHQEFIFSGNLYSFSPIPIFIAGLLSGAISTTFGIGTGFLLVPFYTTVLRLPIYAVASSALLSTLFISAAGTGFYAFLNLGISTTPDLRLGLLLGFGGILGGFVSAKVQRRVSTMNLHRILGATLIIWAFVYLQQGF
jgi:uncharacterized membrane protein YfcA